MGKKKSKRSSSEDPNHRVISTNRRARRDYTIEDTFEVGIVLQGTEVKSLRAGKLSFKDSYASIADEELWLLNLHIDEFAQGNRNNHIPTRKRKLLMRKREILKLLGKIKQSGYTLIPLQFYFKRSWVKIELGLCKGKKQHDQRQDIAKREAKRQIDRAMKRSREE